LSGPRVSAGGGSPEKLGFFQLSAFVLPRLRYSAIKSAQMFFARIICFSFSAFLVLGTGGVLPAGQEQTALAAKIEEVINGPDYKQSHWGILIADQETGSVLYEHNADKLFAPASATKLFTAAAALDALGADYRFKTPVFRRGDVDEAGTLSGDLILVAGGDLTLGGRTDAEGHIAFKDVDHTYANGSSEAELTEPNPLAGLDELARQVAATGIKRVHGEVLVDDRLFEKTASTGSGPTRLSPIMVNDNLVDFLITPNVAGMPAAVTSRPKTAAVRVDARVETVEAGRETITQITVPAPGQVIVRGQIAADRKPLVRVSEFDDASSAARTMFIEALRRVNVAVDASPLTANHAELLPVRDSYRQDNRVALLVSPPLSESLRLILKVSHNFQASTLPLLVAAKNGKRTLADGLRFERDFLARVGVEVDTISFAGGAGGSRADYVTPRATLQLLRHLVTRSDFAAYETALPILGVDGTLARAVDPDSPARARVRAKTGTLAWDNLMNDTTLLTSKALAGYLTTAKGRRLAFAMFVNLTHLPKGAEPTREGRMLGHLCEIICDDQ